MVIVPIWDPSERFFWGIALAIALMCGIYFIYKARKREVFNEKIIMFGLSSLPLGFALSLIFTYFQVFQVQGTFINNIFYGDYDIINSTYEILGRLSYISLGIGGLFYVLAFDIIMKRTRYCLTIFYAIFTAIEIFLPFEGSFFNIDFSELARFVFNFPILLGLLILVPIVLYLSQVIPNVEANILWWALALGACFGGNGTLIGASANVVTSGLAEKAGHAITFIDFMKVGLPVMILTMILSTIWLVFVFPHIMRG